MTPIRWVAFVLAWLMLFGSGISVIWSKHQARTLFVDLQRLEKQRDQLDVEWGQLKLQQSSNAAHGRVEQVARAQLRMLIPAPNEVSLVKATMPQMLPAALPLARAAPNSSASMTPAVSREVVP